MKSSLVFGVIFILILNRINTLPIEEVQEVSQIPTQTNASSVRIIGGNDALPGTLGYMAGLIINLQRFCGGSLIREDFVLTAAHCVHDAVEIQVIVGYHDIDEALSTQQVLISREHYSHPEFRNSTQLPRATYADVGLVRIPLIDSSNPNLQIIPLATSGDFNGDITGLIGILSGWGCTSLESNAIASNLQTVSLEIMNQRSCSWSFGQILTAFDHFCTVNELGVGACSGDSGSPLVVDGVQVGILTFFPVYTRVTSYLGYINSILAT